MGGSLGKFQSCGPVLLRHGIGQVSYGRGRKGEHKCWNQSLDKLILLILLLLLLLLLIIMILMMMMMIQLIMIMNITGQALANATSGDHAAGTRETRPTKTRERSRIWLL